MAVDIPRLRYWFATAAITTASIVAFFYFYARVRAGDVVTELPTKLPTGVQQSTHSFSLSKSEGGHTLFTVRAQHATQYSEGGRAQLKDVSIVIYGHASNRFDQIYGADFSYDPNSGDVVANSTVHIDLQGDTTATPHPDQTPPKELKNPIHLRTSGLIFNQKSGDAHTDQRIDFQLPQASGWAVGARYNAKQNVLTLDRDVHISITDGENTSITARQGLMSKDPRRAVLSDARIVRQDSTVDTAQLTLFLRPDDSVEKIEGKGGVNSTTTGPTTLRVQAPEAVLHLKGRTNELETSDLMGGTKFETSGTSVMFGSADTVHMDYAASSRLNKLHAEGNVKLLQPARPANPGVAPQKSAVAGSPSSHAQNVELDADAIDFWVVNGNELQRAETSQQAQIVLTPQTPAVRPVDARVSSVSVPQVKPGVDSTAPENECTVITADKFYASFKSNRIDSLTGKSNARVVSHTPGQAERISTSRSIEVAFVPTGGIAQVVQRDDFRYQEALPDGTNRSAWAGLATYSVATNTLVLNHQPRVVEGGMTTTARVVRMDNKSGDASGEGDVKTTYSEVKPQPGGGLLASGDPIHVTARTMTAQRSTGISHYSGDARLWQGANIVAAPVIDFDRNTRSVSALGDRTKRVATLLTQQDKSGKKSPINVTSARLRYSDNQRLAQFDGAVVVRSADGTLTANHVDVYLKPAGPEKSANSSPLPSQASQVDTVIADGKVVLQQPTRRATGERLVYTVEQDQYVLTGGTPTIFDAERGTVTGASLTFYNRDDKVLVEGSAQSRAVTHTRVSK